jgi:hypothetical protein
VLDVDEAIGCTALRGWAAAPWRRHVPWWNSGDSRIRELTALSAPEVA